MYDVLIPIVVSVVIGLVLAAFYYFRYRTRAEMQQTVRVALDKGQDLSPELIDRLGEPRRTRMADLRKGVMAIFVAVGIALFGMTLGEEDAVRPLVAIAVLPFLVGIAYLVLWRLNPTARND